MLAPRLAKERSAEDHLFGDKEKFVTAAYKKKLEEEKQWLAEEKVREAQEQKNDVVKKGHMGDFYRWVFSCSPSNFGGLSLNGMCLRCTQYQGSTSNRYITLERQDLPCTHSQAYHNLAHGSARQHIYW